jgi:hypothetical protein
VFGTLWQKYSPAVISLGVIFHNLHLIGTHFLVFHQSEKKAVQTHSCFVRFADLDYEIKQDGIMRTMDLPTTRDP